VQPARNDSGAPQAPRSALSAFLQPVLDLDIVIAVVALIRNREKDVCIPSPSCLPELRRGAFGRLLGHNIRSVREGKGLSIEQGACLSGMEVSEWTAFEEGYVPQDINRLRAMAGAIEIRFDQIAMLVLLCRDAWEL
jgi:hypothetical protein